jgi:hypothetical protein
LSRNIKTDFIKINNFPFIIYSEYSEQLNISNKDSEKIKKELLKKGLVNFNNTGLLTDYFYWKFYYCSNNPSKMVCYGKHQIEKLQHDSMKSMDSDNFKPFEESNFYQECD